MEEKMNKTTIGMIVGGIIPAILFSVGSIFQKLSNKSGLGLSVYLLSVGLGVIFSAMISLSYFSDKTLSLKGCSFAFLQGLCFSCGIIFLAVGLVKYDLPVSQLSPLIATSTLFTGILGLIVLAEYSRVNIPHLLVGSVLIVVGAIVVGNS